MKYVYLKLPVALCLFLWASISLYSQLQPTTCVVVAIYEKKKAEGLKTIDIYGVKEPNYYMVEINLNEGSYEVQLTRIDMDYYEINLKNIIIETKYCYEFPSYKSSILTIDQSNYGSIGYLVFPK